MEPYFKYVIVGGGMAADSAVRGIREIDTNGSIALFSQETDPPYNRPPLSKGLWARTRLSQINRNTGRLGVDLHLGTQVQSIDPGSKTLQITSDERFRFHRLLLATGSSPVTLTASPSGRVIYYRTLQDYHTVRSLSDLGAKFIIVGGGFLGPEMAAALNRRGNPVMLLFHGPVLGARLFPRPIGDLLSREFTRQGVDLYPDESVVYIKETPDRIIAAGTSGREYSADALIASIGVRPNTKLASAAGLEIRQGIRVNSFLQTSHPDIYAAGDVSEFFNPVLETWMRVEHEDHANQSGLAAGRNMAGASIEYAYLPYFYTDLFEFSFYGIGETNPALDTVIDWIEPDRQAVIYYLANGRVRGVVLMNLPYSEIEVARILIADPGPFDPEILRGRIP